MYGFVSSSVISVEVTQLVYHSFSSFHHPIFNWQPGVTAVKPWKWKDKGLMVFSHCLLSTHDSPGSKNKHVSLKREWKWFSVFLPVALRELCFVWWSWLFWCKSSVYLRRNSRVTFALHWCARLLYDTCCLVRGKVLPEVVVSGILDVLQFSWLVDEWISRLHHWFSTDDETRKLFVLTVLLLC